MLAIADHTGRRFAERHVRTLQMLADLVAVAVENAQHYRAVQKAYEDLAETHSRLAQSQKMDSIGRLAGGIAHDFNNLLTVIMARAVLELDRQPAGSTAHKTLTLCTAPRCGPRRSPGSSSPSAGSRCCSRACST